jgi:hypothetical protein
LFFVGTFNEKTFTDHTERAIRKLNTKALHASNHDLKIFDQGQLQSTLPLSAVALTFE